MNAKTKKEREERGIANISNHSRSRPFGRASNNNNNNRENRRG